MIYSLYHKVDKDAELLYKYHSYSQNCRTPILDVTPQSNPPNIYPTNCADETLIDRSNNIGDAPIVSQRAVNRSPYACEQDMEDNNLVS